MTLQYDGLKIACQPYNQTNAKREPAVPSCQVCGKRGHAAIKRFNQSYTPDDIPNALAAITISNGQDAEWFPDSSASAHMTNDPGKLHNLHIYKGPDSVMIGAGHTLKITHTGDALLDTGRTQNFIIKNVLLVPHLKRNLLSISQFTSDVPCAFEFSTSGFVVKDRDGQQVILQGTRNGDLDKLDTPKDQKVQAFFLYTEQVCYGSGVAQAFGASSSLCSAVFA